MPEGDAEAHLAAGTWVRAGTVAELAAAIGVDAATLTATLDRFNAYAAAGEDADFGRGADEYDTFFAGGGGPAAVLAPVAEPPFHAARFVLSDLGTKGGLVTDAAGRGCCARTARRSAASTRPATPRRASPGPCTRAPASRSAPRWSSPRSPSGT